VRRVYVYDWPAERGIARLVLAYLSPQLGESHPERLCIHDVDTEIGPEAKRLALREHRAGICVPKPPANPSGVTVQCSRCIELERVLTQIQRRASGTTRVQRRPTP